MRRLWFGQVGYATTEIRNEVFAAFAAAAGERREHLTPTTWEELPDLPAGLTSGVEVDGLPGFWWMYEAQPEGWTDSDEWAEIATIAIDPIETGGHTIIAVNE